MLHRESTMFLLLPTLALAWPQAPADADGTAARVGQVVETFDSGGFTYVLLRTDQQTLWIAGPETPLAVGDTIATTEGVEIAAFHSRTLDRDFDRIWFVAGLRAMGAEPVVRADAPTPLAPGALPIGEVWERAKELDGAAVVVSGRVARATDGVLGRTWLHLQDGTGGPTTYDLPVTTATPVPVGAVVTARGTLATDRDFGSGYRYAVLLEDAIVEVTP